MQKSQKQAIFEILRLHYLKFQIPTACGLIIWKSESNLVPLLISINWGILEHSLKIRKDPKLRQNLLVGSDNSHLRTFKLIIFSFQSRAKVRHHFLPLRFRKAGRVWWRTRYALSHVSQWSDSQHNQGVCQISPLF